MTLFGYLHDAFKKEPVQEPQSEPQRVTQEPQNAPAPAHQPFKTGSKFVDDGAVCERAQDHVQQACFMAPTQRHRLIEMMLANIPIVIGNYKTALERARVQVLLHKKSGWGPVADMMLDIATAALLAGVGYAAAKVARIGVDAYLAQQNAAIFDAIANGSTAKAAEKAATNALIGAQVGATKDLVKRATTLAKPGIKSHFEHLPREVAARGAFITKLQNNAAPLFTGVRDSVLNGGDDAALVAVYSATQPDNLTVEVFEKQIASLLDRFDKSHIGEIGPRKQGPITSGTIETVLVAAHGHSRLAVVRFGEHKPLSRTHGEIWYTDSSDHFLNFVDDDLIQPAVDMQKQNVGDVKVVDVHRGHKFHRASELDAWVERSRTAGPLQKKGA